MKPQDIPIPLTVPEKSRDLFCQNYTKATRNSGRLFLFAGDQKVEHLNKDFYGPGIASEDADPRHLFEIASHAPIGVCAMNLGLIARYASDYRNVPYMIKLNGKTDIVATQQADPTSQCWTSVQQVVDFKAHTGLDIIGIGLTVYLGSEHESSMLATAAQAIYQAHQHGLLTTVWMYPRGKAVPHERHPDLIAGAAGVAVCLGADFVKLNAPDAPDSMKGAELLHRAVQAAGTTKIICSGGPSTSTEDFLQNLHNQIHVGGAMGAAVGRNIHQKSLKDAVKFCNTLAAVIFDNASVHDAKRLL
jgi:fructose-bisphosphate aldolase / 6-deoxy-5-ketofructose 1-phosphate synthase